MSEVITAPTDEYGKYPSIFLTGSIDMGAAVDWQTDIIELCKPYNVTLYNPRRLDWDSSWEQSVNNPQFVEQVEWELNRLNEAKLIVYYFDVKGLAPITLLELGAFATPRYAVICCPHGYWRKGNVDVYARWQNIDTVDSLEELKQYIENWILENCV